LATPLRTLRVRYGAGPLVLAAALPFLFLHRQYQPTFSAGPVDVTLADVALLVVVATAALQGMREGLAPLRPARSVWILLVLFLAWILVSLSWARSNDPGYALGSHLVSALKFIEFALLAPAVPLLLRSKRDVRVLFAGLTAWSTFLTTIALLQFLGLVNEFEGRRPLQREPSYVGVHELGALSGATLVLALVAIAYGRWRRPSAVAAVAGGLGVALAAALDSVGGVAVAAGTVWLAARARGPVPVRRALTLAAIVLAVGLAAVSLRGSSVTAFLEFLGVRKADTTTQTHVQTYAHRTLLGYIGVKIWLDHPIIGAGWQESLEPAAFRPHLAEAHRRFPTEPAAAFPAPAHRWGIQNGVIQAAADLGVVGLALLLLTVGAAFRLALRAALDREATDARAAAVALGWLIVSFAVLTGTGLLAGTAMDTLLWIAVGLAVVVSARRLHNSPIAPR
jgi:O-antigen ligase